AFLVNTGSSQLLDDCALKQLLIDGTIVGCALDGAEGPQWMEAWVKEMPNVLILPRSADYSEEVWMEIREKAISILQSYFLDGVIPRNAVSDEDDEENESGYEEEQSRRQDKERALQVWDDAKPDTIGLRSFAAGGKLLQINRRMEFVFASHSFDVWENWALEGSFLEECRLVNCRNPSAVLNVRIEILAAVDEEDGVAR
ncbi:hypothetical protein MKW94_012446, partial [Papaver nudicaule]|nr:hypothetical protein [Papaver nudicaule]